ncbi:HAMP domain-containing sensor histidine kinase [Sphingomonas sp.]|uniref:sensor histidine kinase n=1 Tax=Sphingomonas sp. TaxID=28214 RepID=UPI002619524C|nr:HAMP domain-containing sensor histidine kinase [Sphingomonas sp.]MDF2494429.1 sensor histidine kinase [Sphingomonas sp.]
MIEGITMSARVDAADRLIDADPEFATLNERAGGALGRPPANPQIAAMVRLSRRLQIPLARAVTIADMDVDLDCWVRVAPGEGETRLTISPMRERAAWRPVQPVMAVPPPAGADWTWDVDAGLRLQRLASEAAQRHGIDMAMALGQPLTRLFTLESDPHGALPLLEAVASVDDFADQPAVLTTSGDRVILAGHVRRDRGGAFAGFAGATFLCGAKPSASGAANAGMDGAFNHRLDRILRAPLGRIVANADSINAGIEGPIDPQYADYAADIASAGRHLMGLIDDLADIEAIERADFTAEAGTVDLADVVRRAAGLLAVRAADAGVTIDRAGLDQPQHVRGEFRRILQIMVNLIGNAVRYSPRDATIWLRLQRDGDHVFAIVADQGKGIAVEDHERVFAKFERVDTSEPGGSGLGLYIARRLARVMGGDLTVDSAPCEGARFVLSLPAV